MESDTTMVEPKVEKIRNAVELEEPVVPVDCEIDMVESRLPEESERSDKEPETTSVIDKMRQIIKESEEVLDRGRLALKIAAQMLQASEVAPRLTR